MSRRHSCNWKPKIESLLTHPLRSAGRTHLQMTRSCSFRDREDIPMALSSTIEWTDATWNPVTGCTQVSAGCDHCYAKTFAERFRGVPGHPYEQGFDLKLWPNRLELPLHWKRPRRIFVNSMSDLFHERIPDDFIRRVFEVMNRADWHTYQVLTKRPR